MQDLSLASRLRGLAALACVAVLGATPAHGQPAAPITDLPHGLVGAYFAPAQAGAPLVLVLGGSEGGLRSARSLAERLSKEGFGALALAYFGAPGVPQAVQNIPLEYFGQALDWLALHPEAKGRKLLVLGGSKGAEAALILAARDLRICGVVAGAPSSVAWAGINTQNFSEVRSSWSWKGSPVAYVPYDVTAPFTGLLDLYERSLAKAPPEAVIPVEKIGGPVLLISGREDKIWPSARMGEAVMDRLKASGRAKGSLHLVYDHAGHAAFGPPLGPSVNAGAVTALGGTLEAVQASRADSWPKALAFLTEVGRGPGCSAKR